MKDNTLVEKLYSEFNGTLNSIYSSNLVNRINVNLLRRLDVDNLFNDLFISLKQNLDKENEKKNNF